ncbi:MAG: anaerobic ribonucleoside-triphosphate reductase activating protein [Candidatus Eisenbacteria bacterium]
MKSLEIKGFVEASFCDWDGRVSSVVFLPGCNLRCPFCQNGDLILQPESMTSIDFASLRAYLSRNREWIDGVVVTGGEPTIWDDLPQLLLWIKDLGFPLKLDTNGTRPDLLKLLVDRGLVDYIAMDLKAPLDARYAVATGVHVDLGAITRSIEIVRSCPGDAYEFRTTLVPGLVGEQEVVEIARSIEGAARYVLQQFVPGNSLDKSLRRAIPYTDDFAFHLIGKARTHVRFCFFRGRAGTSPSLGGGLS